jgi:hypothetical protein
MSEFAIVSIILLAIAAIDAAGDAFRIHQWQIIHHSMEVLGIAVWIALWAFFEFHLVYLTMYITGRIWLFDPLLNLIAGYKLTYSGKSSIYGRVLSWFTHKIGEQGHLIWVLRALAIIWWIAWLITSADGRIF